MTSPSVKQAYSLLAERCNVMLNSKFIMSSNCIASILKVIASVPCLTNYLIKCSQDFSFDAAFNQATKTSKFQMPDDSKTTVALVTELLFRFDRKEIDLTKFIKIYFPEKNFEGSYKAFCQEVIAPYLLSYSTIMREEDVEEAGALALGRPPVGTAEGAVPLFRTHHVAAAAPRGKGQQHARPHRLFIRHLHIDHLSGLSQKCGY